MKVTTRNSDGSRTDPTHRLRLRAEEIFAKTGDDFAEMTGQAVQELFCELQIHQIELEMQNEALRESQLELVESRDRYAKLYDFAPIGFIKISSDGVIIEANLTATRMLSVDREALIKSKFSDYVARDFQDEWFLHRQRILANDRDLSCTLALRRPEGKPLFVRLQSETLDDDSEGAFLMALSDVTEQTQAETELRELESQLAHVSRLSTMGEMVAGIAHEVNQPLFSIVNFGKAAKQALKQPNAENSQEIGQWMDQITESAARAGQIIQRLREFVSPQSTRRVPVNLGEAIQSSVDLVRHEAKRNQVSIRTDFPRVVPIAFGDPIQIQQVLVNLLVNAIEAMSESSIRETVVSVSCDQRVAEISVADLGTGIPSQYASTLFNAFVTTKPKGMGMGLAISRTIVESMGGRLWGSNNARSGATFRFTLPLVSEQSPHDSDSV